MLIEDVYPHVQNLLGENKEKTKHALLKISDLENHLVDCQD